MGLISLKVGDFIHLHTKCFCNMEKCLQKKDKKLLTSKIFLLKSLLSRKNSDEGFKGKLCTEDTKYGASS